MQVSKFGQIMRDGEKISAGRLTHRVRAWLWSDHRVVGVEITQPYGRGNTIRYRLTSIVHVHILWSD